MLIDFGEGIKYEVISSFSFGSKHVYLVRLTSSSGIQHWMVINEFTNKSISVLNFSHGLEILEACCDKVNKLLMLN